MRRPTASSGGCATGSSHCHQLPFNFLVAGFRRFFGGGAGPGPGGTSRMGRANRSANFRRISRTRRSGGFIRWWCHTSCHGAEFEALSSATCFCNAAIVAAAFLASSTAMPQ